MSRGPEGENLNKKKNVFDRARGPAAALAALLGVGVASHEVGRIRAGNERPAASQDQGETENPAQPTSTAETTTTSGGEASQSETREYSSNCFDLNVQFSGVHAPAEGNTLHLEYYVMSTGSQPLSERACRTIEGLSDIPGEPNTPGRLSSFVARDLDTFLTQQGTISSNANIRVLREERMLLTEQQYRQNRAVHIQEDAVVAENQFLVAMLVERNAQGAIVRNSLPKVVPHNAEEPPSFARFGVVDESVWEYPGQRARRLSRESGEGLLGQ